jgi:hypothetical protein
MQANIAIMIPNYVDDEERLFKLWVLKEEIETTLDQTWRLSIEENANEVNTMKYSVHSMSKIIISIGFKLHQSVQLIRDDINSSEPNPEAHQPEDGIERQLCTICFEMMSLQTLSCSHQFCTEVRVFGYSIGSWITHFQFIHKCIQEYLKFNMLEGNALDLTCPDKTCDYVLCEADVKHFLNERQFARFTICAGCISESR